MIPVGRTTVLDGLVAHRYSAGSQIKIQRSNKLCHSKKVVSVSHGDHWDLSIMYPFRETFYLKNKNTSTHNSVTLGKLGIHLIFADVDG